MKTVAPELSAGESEMCIENVMLAVVKHWHRNFMTCTCLHFGNTSFGKIQSMLMPVCYLAYMSKPLTARSCCLAGVKLLTPRPLDSLCVTDAATALQHKQTLPRAPAAPPCYDAVLDSLSLHLRSRLGRKYAVSPKLSRIQTIESIPVCDSAGQFLNYLQQCNLDSWKDSIPVCNNAEEFLGYLEQCTMDSQEHRQASETQTHSKAKLSAPLTAPDSPDSVLSSLPPELSSRLGQRSLSQCSIASPSCPLPLVPLIARTLCLAACHQSCQAAWVGRRRLSQCLTASTGHRTCLPP